MKADQSSVLTGVHFLDGDQACCEGALAAVALVEPGVVVTRPAAIEVRQKPPEEGQIGRAHV